MELDMLTVNMREAKTDLSRLLDRTTKRRAVHHCQGWQAPGQGRPAETPVQRGRVRRLGLMTEEIAVPDDFDRMGEAGSAQLFGGGC